MILIAFSAKAVYDNPCLTFIEPKPGLKPHVEIHNTTLMKSNSNKSLANNVEFESRQYI